MQGLIFHLRVFSECRAILCHWGTPVVRSNYSPIINRISFICYDKHCHQMMRGGANMDNNNILLLFFHFLLYFQFLKNLFFLEDNITHSVSQIILHCVKESKFTIFLLVSFTNNYLSQRMQYCNSSQDHHLVPNLEDFQCSRACEFFPNNRSDSKE